MRPGPVIRKLFGPYEHWVAEAYRRFFIDLDEFAELMGAWVPQASRILEVGCGEGAMTERITREYPNASITAIDITPRIGRLFRGQSENVTFSRARVEDVAQREPRSYDLIVLADVVHHVPVDARQSLMSAICAALTPNGTLIFKEWIASSGLVHWLCDASDRYLTGDNVSYLNMRGINELVSDTFGPCAIRQTNTIRPWRNNVITLIQPTEQVISQNIETNEANVQVNYE